VTQSPRAPEAYPERRDAAVSIANVARIAATRQRRGIADNLAMTSTRSHSTHDKPLGPHGAGCAIGGSGPRASTGVAMVHLACPLA
jgi:hypothetical protein